MKQLEQPRTTTRATTINSTHFKINVLQQLYGNGRHHRSFFFDRNTIIFNNCNYGISYSR